MAESSELTVGKKLSEIFEEAYNLFYSFKTCYDPTNSPEFQAKVKQCIGLFEDSTRLVSLIGMFSTNETYEEIATEDLKYLLLPFFLAQLTLKLCGGERKEIVDVADVYFK
jgi:immunoglobulin-binding protein 1